jgi:CHAD domain-containing protein
LNEQIKELAAKLTMIQDSFGNLLDKMMQRIKLNSNKSFKV